MLHNRLKQCRRAVFVKRRRTPLMTNNRGDFDRTCWRDGYKGRRSTPMSSVVHHSKSGDSTCAAGQNAKSRGSNRMSALPPIATARVDMPHFRYVSCIDGARGARGKSVISAKCGRLPRVIRRNDHLTEHALLGAGAVHHIRSRPQCTAAKALRASWQIVS